jgi:hypothetical protein
MFYSSKLGNAAETAEGRVITGKFVRCSMMALFLFMPLAVQIGFAAGPNTVSAASNPARRYRMAG